MTERAGLCMGIVVESWAVRRRLLSSKAAERGAALSVNCVSRERLKRATEGAMTLGAYFFRVLLEFHLIITLK